MEELCNLWNQGIWFCNIRMEI